MSPADFVRLCSHYTVARLLERDDFAKRYGAGRADLGARVPLPLRAGLRLGRARSGRRARRHRPDLQPADGVARSSATTGRAPRRCSPIRCSSGTDGSTEKMSKSLGNIVGHHRAARGDVRQGDEHLRRADARLVRPGSRAASGRTSPPSARPGGGEGRSAGLQAGAGAAPRRALPRRGGRRRERAPSTSGSVVQRKEVPDDVPETPFRRARRAIGACSSSWSRPRALAASNSEARRLVGPEGGVDRRESGLRPHRARRRRPGYLLKVGKRRSPGERIGEIELRAPRGDFG